MTICTDARRCLFGSVRDTFDNGEMVLNDIGWIVSHHINGLNDRYSSVSVDKYVIMPNHIHMILELDNDNQIPLTQIIGLLKSGISREIGFKVWQRSFHDHIIRNETDYINIWNYIEHNPAGWAMDRYYNQS